MKGIQHIEVSNRKVKFKLDLIRNITMIRGESGTGKTTLYNMISDYTRLQESSGVNLSSEKPCVALMDMDWQNQLSNTRDSIVFIDEGAKYISSAEFAAAIKASLLVTIGRWLRAQCVLIVITFFQLLVGLLLIRQPYALLLAVVIAFIDALPVFGTGTVLLPWAVLCCLEGNFPKGIALTALYLVIWLVRSIMEPKLMAQSAGLPPLPALAAMYIGFCAMGVAGMILGPILLLLIKQLHDGGYLRLWK